MLREQMAGFGWLTPRILAHDDTPDFYLDQVAQVVTDRWSSGHVGLLGDAAFSASPMPGAGTQPSPEPDVDAMTALIERAVNGPELPDYEGVPDSGMTAGATPGARRA